ncbi:translation initiation factor 4G [Senna tora]|uniref:Translation initiation factor 4G n=1 Tax=Senna tora TaxID=362788 RepID=A0A834X9U9_9FABA|nr:translation initiation factor 4G [Senna tora]
MGLSINGHPRPDMKAKFVIIVAETVVIIQERTFEPLNTLNRASTPIPFSGFLP